MLLNLSTATHVPYRTQYTRSWSDCRDVLSELYIHSKCHTFGLTSESLHASNLVLLTCRSGVSSSGQVNQHHACINAITGPNIRAKECVIFGIQKIKINTKFILSQYLEVPEKKAPPFTQNLLQCDADAVITVSFNLFY
jgi:hypothetical protein